MTIHELQQENQALQHRNAKLKANYRKLQIQLADRDKRIEGLYRCLQENNITPPIVSHSRAYSQLESQGRLLDYVE